jgi:hypothetical protein
MQFEMISILKVINKHIEQNENDLTGNQTREGPLKFVTRRSTPHSDCKNNTTHSKKFTFM